jgi:hypothetical protein
MTILYGNQTFIMFKATRNWILSRIKLMPSALILYLQQLTDLRLRFPSKLSDWNSVYNFCLCHACCTSCPSKLHLTNQYAYVNLDTIGLLPLHEHRKWWQTICCCLIGRTWRRSIRQRCVTGYEPPQNSTWRSRKNMLRPSPEGSYYTKSKTQNITVWIHNLFTMEEAR